MKNLSGIKGNRKHVKGKLKQNLMLLNEDDMMFVEGEMIGRLQASLGKTKEEINKLISEL